MAERQIEHRKSRPGLSARFAFSFDVARSVHTIWENKNTCAEYEPSDPGMSGLCLCRGSGAWDNASDFFCWVLRVNQDKAGVSTSIRRELRELCEKEETVYVDV